MRQYILPMLAICTIALAGCSSSSSPNGSTAVVHPNEGSTFTFVTVITDSAGKVVPPIDTTVETFAGVGFTLNGETNVDQLVDNQDGNLTGTSYLHYESDGDVSYLSPGGYFGALNGWWLFPFASQQTVSITGDTIENGDTLQSTLTFQGAGSGSITIMGQTFSEERVTGSIAGISTSLVKGKVTTVTGTQSLGTISFAPALGETVETSVPGTRNATTGKMGNSEHYYAIGYTLN